MALHIYREDDEFCTIKWHIADLVDALEGAGFEVTDDNIAAVLDHSLSSCLEGCSIEYGWNVIYDTITCALGDSDEF